jgi:hypothetical protein
MPPHNRGELLAKSSKSSNMTWAGAFRDVFVAAINKGQLIPLGVFLIIALIIYKMPENEILNLVKEILLLLKQGYLAGYAFSFILTFGWYFHSKSLRKQYSLEYERIGIEKSDLQGKLIGVKLDSSNG